MSEVDQQRLLDAVASAAGPEAERDHALFAMMLATGIRLGSAISLDVEDVDIAGAQVMVRRAKGDAPDRVFLNDTIKTHLSKFLAGRTTGPVFPAHQKRLSQRHAQRRLTQWLAKAGITATVSAHSMRHAFATRIYAKTSDIRLTQAALRHRSITSTTVYARATEERLRAAL